MEKDIIKKEEELIPTDKESVLMNDSKKTAEDDNKERSFKEGLEDNSHTEKK